MKRLIAYAMLSALSFCTLGIFCFSLSGLNGAVYQILNEGLSGSALADARRLPSMSAMAPTTWSCTEVLAAKLPDMATLYRHHRALADRPAHSQWLRRRVPVLSASFASHPGWVIAATLGVILSAAYMLWHDPDASSTDRNRRWSPSSTCADFFAREILAARRHGLLMLVMGVASPFWMRAIDEGVAGLANSTQTAHHLQSTLAEKR